MSLALPVLVVALMVAVNALYVAAEFATVGVRKSRIAQLAEEGNRQARRILPILVDGRRLDHYIAACQIGITLSSLVLGAYGQATFGADAAELLVARGVGAAAAQTASVAGTLVVLTTLQVVFGELLPKSLALQFPVEASLALYWPMRVSEALFGPFIRVFNGSGFLVLRLLGLPPADGHRHIHSPDEITMLVAESHDGGLLDEEEHHRLSQALQLGRRTARQLMVPRRSVQAIDVDTSPDDVLALAERSPHSRLPVFRGTIDDVVGILHAKDLVARFAERGNADGWLELVRPMAVVPATMPADRLVGAMRSRRARQALVVDEFGGVDGIVTLEDVLWELVGEVGDEFRPGEPEAEPLPDGRVRLPGAMRIDEAARWHGSRWDGAAATTIGGLVQEELGRVPTQGERLDVRGVEVEIERMDGPAVASVLVVPAPQAGPEDGP